MRSQGDIETIQKALVSIAFDSWVKEADIFNLIGIEYAELQSIAKAYPDISQFNTDKVNAAIHNTMNLFVNGLHLSDKDWSSKIGVSREGAEAVFERLKNEAKYCA